MLYTQIPTEEQIVNSKFNVGKSPEQVVFRTEEEKLQYVKDCEALISQTPQNLLTGGNDVFVMDSFYGRVAIRSFHLDSPSLEDDLVLAPHCDDEVIATGAYAMIARRSGRRLRTLIFTVGSGARMDHGLNEDQCRVARLAASLRGSVGLYSTVDIITIDGVYGFPEWFWGRDGGFVDFGTRLARMYNARRVLAPHHDPQVDVHYDHTGVGLVAKAMCAHGQWTDYHPTRIPDRRILAVEGVRQPALWQYRVWSGERNWLPNFNVRYERGDFAELSRRIGEHRTESVKLEEVFLDIDNTYAAAKITREMSDRWWVDVNNPQIYALESYIVPVPTTTVTSLVV